MSPRTDWLENWRSTPGQPEEREKWRQPPKKNLHRRHNRHCTKSSTILCCTTGLSTDSGDELNLRHHPLSQPSLHDHRDVRTVDELRQQCHRPPCQVCCNCGTFAVFLHSDIKHLSLNTTGMSTTLSKEETGCNCGISTVSHNCCKSATASSRAQARAT